MDQRRSDDDPHEASTGAATGFAPFSRPWWTLVLILAPLGGVAAYFRWLSPNPYPVFWIGAFVVSFVALSSAIAVLQRRRPRRA
jgi:FtsH-binding integral membrane protein